MTATNDDPSRPPNPAASSSHPTIPFDRPYTFTQIIDADHFTIQRLAAQIRRLLTSIHPQHTNATTSNTSSNSTSSPPTPHSPLHVLSHLHPLLLEATWRLIRHDLSEDLVMRPTFTTHLGPHGTQMANHDHTDHAAGRSALLECLAQLASLESLLAGQPPHPDPVSGSDPDPIIPAQLTTLTTTITRTFNDLGNHMSIESGEFLPYFESLVDGATSRRLAREYAATLVLSPWVSVADGGERRALFPGGVGEYVNTELPRLRELYALVVEDAGCDGGEYFRNAVRVEMESLRVGKWVGMNERKTLGKSGSSDGKGKL